MINPSATATSRGPGLLQTSAAGTAIGASWPASSTAVDSAAAPAWPNPSLRIDPALGIVVMEFRDQTGSIEGTLPTERQLEAYRTAASRRHADTANMPAADAPQDAPAPLTGGVARITTIR